jgi:uncharacterized membrane protein
MTTTARHPLVEDYLKRLWAEAAQLPVDQARELVADIDEHLVAALPEGASEAEVRNVLERLGTPGELVAAAGGPPEERSRTFASPTGAIVCLVAAEVLCLLLPMSIPLWILGLVMMARAQVWSDREKWLGMIGLGSGFPVAIVFLAASTLAMRSCTSWATSDGASGSTCGGVDWVAIVAWTVALGYVALQAFTIWRLVRSARRR